jgi:perosamine synthetase
MKKIRLFKPDLTSQELKAVARVFKRSWIGQGPEVVKFENEFKRFVKSRNAIATNSGSAALHLAVSAFNFKKGKNILVNNLTFVSSANGVLFNNLKPILIDCDPVTLGFDLEDAKKKINKNTVAIIVVHYGGHPAEMEKIIKFAKKNKIKVIEDCAHCIGGSFKGKKLGTWGDIGCFSFEEKKGLTTGDGGMIVTNDDNLVKPIKQLRWCGIEKDTWKRSKNLFINKKLKYEWYYEVSREGYKFNMNDLSASIGRVQLKRFRSLMSKKNSLIRYYIKKIQSINFNLLLPYDIQNNSYWIMGLKHKKRDLLMNHLNKNNISTGVHYLPLSKHPLYKKYDKGLKVSNNIWQEILTLPLHTGMSKKDIDRIAYCLNNFQK